MEILATIKLLYNPRVNIHLHILTNDLCHEFFKKKALRITQLAVYSLTIPVSPPLMVKSRLQYFSAYPKRLINMAVNAPAAPEYNNDNKNKQI